MTDAEMIKLMKFEIIEAITLCTDARMIKQFETFARVMITPDIKRKRTAEEKAARAEIMEMQPEDIAD